MISSLLADIFCILTLLGCINTVLSQPARMCKAEDFKYGQWIRGSHHCGLLDKYGPGLAPKYYETSSFQVNSWSSYCWKPYDCVALPFNKTKFCQVLNGRNMLFVGDSLLHQMYQALLLQSGISASSVRRGILCGDVHKGSVHFVWNDQLSISNENAPHTYIRNGSRVSDPHPAAGNNMKWKHFLGHSHIIVLNKGHHLERFAHLYDAVTGLPKVGKESDDEFNIQTRHTVNFLYKHAGLRNKEIFSLQQHLVIQIVI